MPVYSAQSEEFSHTKIVNELFVSKNHQTIVYQQIIIEDQITLEGDLILIC